MFSVSHSAKGCLGLGLIACAACVGPANKPDAIQAPQVFYTLTGEIALTRHEPRVAALQYTAAAELDADPKFLARASEVTDQCLQPTLSVIVATRWIGADPAAIEAHRAAAKAWLELFEIGPAAEQYRFVVSTSTRGADLELTDLEAELSLTENVFAARLLADRLAADYPTSVAALRLEGFAALRGDAPAVAVHSFSAALELLGAGAGEPDKGLRRELTQGLWRARILNGDAQEPLAQSQALSEREATPANQLDHALLLLAAQQDDAALAQLQLLARQPELAPVALRLTGLVEFQNGRLDAASDAFTQLLTLGKFIDDAFYYLGQIAERHGDFERAVRLYARVQNGDNAVPALLRACAILQVHGAAGAAQDLLDHLVEEEPQRAPEIMAARARIYLDAGDAAQAFDVLDRGALQYPDSVDIRYARASTYESQGRIDAALQELKQVLKSRPEDPAALNAYGYTLADHKLKLGYARTLIERAHATAPKNAAILDSLGWVLFRQGHAEQALTYLNDAYADDRGGDIAAHLGEVMWSMGRRADAERVWSEAGAIDSDNKVLNATRQRLRAEH